MTHTNILAALLAAGTLAALSAPAAADRIDRRQDNQESRIRNGLRTGELSRAEAYRLEAEQARIRALEREAGRDGYVSPRERARIAAAQDEASRNIYREKHDGERRGSWSRRGLWNEFYWSRRWW